LCESICKFFRNTGTDRVPDILRYSISLDRIEKVSSLSTATDRGLAVLSNDGKSIYYFGGYPIHKAVYKFDSVTNITTRLPNDLPSEVIHAAGISINGTIFIFNGHQRNVLEFSEISDTAKIIGDLPFQSRTSTVYATVAIPNGNGSVWLFAGNNEKPTNPILLYNIANKVAHVPTTDSTSLPTLFYQPTSIWDGHHGYLIGGIGRAPERNGSYHPASGILT
jgi:hypothetical protein